MYANSAHFGGYPKQDYTSKTQVRRFCFSLSLTTLFCLDPLLVRQYTDYRIGQTQVRVSQNIFCLAHWPNTIFDAL